MTGPDGRLAALDAALDAMFTWLLQQSTGKLLVLLTGAAALTGGLHWQLQGDLWRLDPVIPQPMAWPLAALLLVLLAVAWLRYRSVGLTLLAAAVPVNTVLLPQAVASLAPTFNPELELVQALGALGPLLLVAALLTLAREVRAGVYLAAQEEAPLHWAKHRAAAQQRVETLNQYPIALWAGAGLAGVMLGALLLVSVFGAGGAAQPRLQGLLHSLTLTAVLALVVAACAAFWVFRTAGLFFLLLYGINVRWLADLSPRPLAGWVPAAAEVFQFIMLVLAVWYLAREVRHGRYLASGEPASRFSYR